MRFLIFMIMGFCALIVHADPEGTDVPVGQSAERTAPQAVVEEPSNGTEAAGEGQSAESPWQGTWTGSELGPSGTRVSVTARIRVTDGKISGTWRARGSGQRNITGQVNGNEASITILQGGSKISATLVDKDKFEYRGLRGHGTLSRQ